METEPGAKNGDARSVVADCQVTAADCQVRSRSHRQVSSCTTISHPAPSVQRLAFFGVLEIRAYNSPSQRYARRCNTFAESTLHLPTSFFSFHTGVIACKWNFCCLPMTIVKYVLNSTTKNTNRQIHSSW